MRTGDLFKNGKSAYEIDAELGGIGSYIDENGNETISVLPRFSINSGNVDDKGNADLFSYTSGFNVLNFKIGGSYPAAVGTSGLGHTAIFNTLPSMTITNPAGVNEYKIYVSPDKTLPPIQVAGDIYRQKDEPNFGNKYIAENPLGEETILNNNTLVVKAGLRCFAPIGKDNSGNKNWGNLYLSLTQNYLPSLTDTTGLHYLILTTNNTIDCCSQNYYYEVDSLSYRPDINLTTNTIYCYVKDENKMYKKAKDAISYTEVPGVIIGEFNIDEVNNVINWASLYKPQGKQPVWLNTSINPIKTQMYNIDSSQWEDFDYIYVGDVKLASYAQDAQLQQAITNPYNFNIVDEQYSRFAVNNAIKDIEGNNMLLVPNNYNYLGLLSINEEGYISPNTSNSNKALLIPAYYSFYPSGNWEIVLDIQTTSNTPSAEGVLFSSIYTPTKLLNISINYNTDKTLGVYLSSNGTTWDLVSNGKSTALTASTRYLIKLSYNGSLYKLEASTNVTKPVYSTIWSLSSSTKVFVPTPDQIKQLIQVKTNRALFNNYNGVNSPLQQMGLYLTNCYLKDGDNKIWEGRNWKRVAAIAPFKYTDTQGITRVQNTNLYTNVNRLYGKQNFIIENQQLKAVGNIYRQKTEPDFVLDNSSIISAPTVPITFAGSTFTIKSGLKTLISCGKSYTQERQYDTITLKNDQVFNNTVSGTNINSTLFITKSQGSSDISFLTIDSNSIVIANIFPDKDDISTTTYLWYSPLDNIWRWNNEGGTIWSNLLAAPIATYITVDTNNTISNLNTYDSQNGFPLWYDISSEPYKCYSYEE